jgi:hypothetical protein
MKTFVALVLAGLLAVSNAEHVPAIAASRALRSADAAATTTTSTTTTGLTSGSVVSIVESSISIGTSIAAAVSAASSSKDCHQLACWVAAPSYDCQFAAANQVQRDLTRGRNSFGVEGSDSSGMWVRYWRTQFYPPDQGDVSKGTCTNGESYTVTNCQATEGKVYC